METTPYAGALAMMMLLYFAFLSVDARNQNRQQHELALSNRLHEQKRDELELEVESKRRGARGSRRE